MIEPKILRSDGKASSYRWMVSKYRLTAFLAKIFHGVNPMKSAFAMTVINIFHRKDSHPERLIIKNRLFFGMGRLGLLISRCFVFV